MQRLVETSGTFRQSDFGTTLSEHEIKKGLKELHAGVTFDITTNLGGWHPLQGDLQGVFVDGVHVAPMGRGVIPEFNVFDQGVGHREISMSEAENHEGAMITYIQVLPTDPGYHDALLAAERKDDNFQLDDDGKLFYYKAIVVDASPRRIVRCGWRHTFKRLAASGKFRKIDLEKKFKVDLSKYDHQPEPELMFAEF